MNKNIITTRRRKHRKTTNKKNIGFNNLLSPIQNTADKTLLQFSILSEFPERHPNNLKDCIMQFGERVVDIELGKFYPLLQQLFRYGALLKAQNQTTVGEVVQVCSLGFALALTK